MPILERVRHSWGYPTQFSWVNKRIRVTGMPNSFNKVSGDISSHTPLPAVRYPSFFTKFSHVRNILLYVLVVSCCRYHIQLLYIFIYTLCEGIFVHLINAFNKRTFLVKNTFVFLKWTKIDDQASSFFIFVVLLWE